MSSPLLARVASLRVTRAALTYMNTQAPAYAAGLAYSTLLSMFPLALGVLAIVGLVVHDPATRQTFENAITGAFPTGARGEVAAAIEGVRRSAGILGIASVVLLFWFGTSLFIAVEFVLAKIFGTGQRDPLRQRLMGLAMLAVFVVAIAADAAGNALIALLPRLPYAGFAIGTVAMSGLFVAVYRLVPNRTFGVAQIWPGALVAGVGVEILTLIFPLYAHLAHGFNTYGQQFALFFLLAVWAMLLAQILLMGAVYIGAGAGTPRAGGLFASPEPREEAPIDVTHLDPAAPQA